MTLLDAERATWTPVCRAADLIPERGVAVLVDRDAVAVFLLLDGSVRAIGDVDPCSGASVLSRGLVGQTERAGTTVRYVASPLRKQRFDLDTGCGLDGDAHAGTWPAQIVDGMVEVGQQASRWGNGPETGP